MRLIDADRLLNPGYTDMFDEPMKFAWYSREAIETQPTVEAIPIEWIKAYFKKCLSFDDRVFIDNEDSNYDIVIDKYKIFEEWEKENGAE